MNNLQQVKKIVQAKWNKSNGNGSNFSQEELTAEAEKILKKTQSKYLYLGKTKCQSNSKTCFYFQKTAYLVKPRNM